MTNYQSLEAENPILFKKHRKVVQLFTGCQRVLELGPAQGVFLHLAKQADIGAEGVDQDPGLVAFCKKQGLKVHKADGMAFIRKKKASSLDGFFSSNVVEHLEPKELTSLLDLACSRLKPGGKLALMTANPRAIGIHADAFYTSLDHRRLYPLDLLSALLTERGMDILAAVEDEDTRVQGPLRTLVRKIRTRLIGPFFGPPEIYIAAVKTGRKTTPGKSHLTFRR